MSVTVTQQAAEHISRQLKARGRGEGLRLGVRTSGCSGLAYVLEFADAIASEDRVFENFGIKVVVDTQSFAYLDGTELDFVQEGLNEGFKFNNPKVAAECGCGESFTIARDPSSDP